MRIMLDTNILVSIIFFPSVQTKRIVQAILNTAVTENVDIFFTDLAHSLSVAVHIVRLPCILITGSPFPSAIFTLIVVNSDEIR